MQTPRTYILNRCTGPGVTVKRRQKEPQIPIRVTQHIQQLFKVITV
jgi:hypothetical protein